MSRPVAPIEDVSRKVRAFYEECSFPGYEEFDTPFDLLEKAGRGIYARLLGGAGGRLLYPDRAETLSPSARGRDHGGGTARLGQVRDFR